MKQQRTSTFGRSETPLGLKIEGGVVESNFYNLPSDALIEVFSRLPFHELVTSVPLVCKDWRNVSLDPVCWKKVDMRSWCETRNEQAYFFAVQCEPIMEIMVDMIVDKSCALMVKKIVDRSCGQLREFRTKYCSNVSLEYIAENCPLLVELSIAESKSVTDDSALKLVTGCPKLEKVDFSNCYSISCTSIEALGRSCKSLVWLARNMLQNHELFMPFNGSQVQNVSIDEEAAAISKHMVNLKHLELQNTSLSDVGLRNIARGCPNLESLNLEFCSELTSAALEDFRKRNPNVRLQFGKYGSPRHMYQTTDLDRNSAQFFLGFF